MDSPELELQILVSRLMQVLRTELGSVPGALEEQVFLTSEIHFWNLPAPVPSEPSDLSKALQSPVEKTGD